MLRQEKQEIEEVRDRRWWSIIKERQELKAAEAKARRLEIMEKKLVSSKVVDHNSFKDLTKLIARSLSRKLSEEGNKKKQPEKKSPEQ